MNSSRTLALVASFLVVSLLPCSVQADHPDDMVTPDQAMYGFRRVAANARDYLLKMQEAARSLEAASAACLAAAGNSEACKGVPRAQRFYDFQKEEYQKEFAKLEPWRARVATLVEREMAEDCDSGFMNNWVPFRSSNCHKNHLRYQGMADEANQLTQELQQLETTTSAGAASAVTKAEEAQQTATERAEREAEEARRAAAVLAQAKIDEEAAQQATLEAERERQRIRREQQQAEIARLAAIHEAEQRARDLAEEQEREREREAARERNQERSRRRARSGNHATSSPTDTATPAPASTDYQRNIDYVTSTTNGPIECQGGSGIFGSTMDCGQAGTLTPPDPNVQAPVYIPSQDIVDASVLGVGATVMAGDTLGHIAQRIRRQMGPGAESIPLWGPGGLVDLLAAANNQTDPDRINPQQGIRVPSLECLREAGEARSREVLAKCEALVRVNGVPENLEVTTRLARERIAELEAGGQTFTDQEKQEIIEDTANVATDPASEFAGLSSVPKADFIEAQTGRFGESYRVLIGMVADEAERRGYNDEQRFKLLYRKIRETENSPY